MQGLLKLLKLISVDKVCMHHQVRHNVNVSNHIRVVAFNVQQLTQASVLQKRNQMLQHGFLISVTLRSHRASVACKNHSF